MIEVSLPHFLFPFCHVDVESGPGFGSYFIVSSVVQHELLQVRWSAQVAPFLFRLEFGCFLFEVFPGHPEIFIGDRELVLGVTKPVSRRSDDRPTA